MSREVGGVHVLFHGLTPYLSQFGVGVTQMSIFDFGSQCSNCRVSNDACSAYGSANPFDVDTSSVVAGSGVLAFAGVGLVGVFAMNRRAKRVKKTAGQAKMLQMTGGGAV